ncbi:MAG: hypothetical protein COW55_13160 [Rhodobacteraceae bacterium CG17_big_fil_post_rev_8_21_14_2_50_65_11]|nr:MAG: hypothetical protein COW55_13160 [Rhodobacteraceae bacterium CG17_big_fil_post_rev_8_21_14_2_50_65_11]
MTGAGSLAAAGRGLRALRAVWIAVALLYVISGLISPSMFQVGQVLNILQVAAFLGVVALGQVIVILTGGIDLSQAGMITLTNIVATSLMLGQAETIAVALSICLALAVLVGLMNGLLVVLIGITPLVASLGMNAVLFGAALVYTGGAPRGEAAEAVEVIGTGRVFGIPAPTLIWPALAAALYVLTRRTVVGRWLYATGAIAGRQLFAHTRDQPGQPDGATVDAEGVLWNAQWDGWRLVRYAPDGTVDRIVDLRVQKPTSCIFGGPELKTLFVTTAIWDLKGEALAAQPLAGSLLSLETDVPGLPETRSAG